MKRYTTLWLLLILMLAMLAGCGEVDLPTEILTRPTATPTATLTPTATSTPTPTATATPTPTLTPTPMPSEALAQAERAYHIGDWPTAEALYNRLLPLSSISQEQAVAAMLGLGRTRLASGDAEGAIPVLRTVVSDTVQSAQAVAAHLALADALVQVGQHGEAAPHYQAVLNAYPVLAPYARLWIGDAQYAAGDYAAALATYEAALAEAETASDQVYLWEKIALTHATAGREEEALAAYDAILEIAQIAAYRARIMYQAAETARAFGSTAEAYRRMHELITAYPTAAQAHDALVQLVNAGEPVDEMLRGYINYHAGAYGPAVQAYYRALAADPDLGGEPYYYIGSSYLEAGSYELALDAFQTLDEYPDDPYWGGAWMGKARALRQLGRTDDAVAAYRELAKIRPEHPRAPEALQAAAKILADTGAFAEAAEAYLDLANRYPDDAGAPDARFRAGLLRYRAEDLPGAQAAWRDLTVWYPADDRAQAAHFWLGKSYLAAGQTISATEALSQAQHIDPWAFYGLRAQDLRLGRPPFAQQGPAPTVCGSAAEQQAAEQWLADWLELESAVDVGRLPAELQSDPRLRRGSLLLRLGRFDEGRGELEALREATVGDALAQYRLALYYRDIGLYRSSIIAAATVWRLSPVFDFAELPRFLGCLIYPTYYDDLVEQEAARMDFDPLVVYALLRQESLFEGSATSWAAAHGLMQVIPPTGAQIAQALGWPPNYETPDLYRPMVSVRFGVWYLAEQRDALDQNLFAAMAAYNGGPGNSARWWAAADQDPDLFVELITFSETRTYVTRIREHYARYRWLYRESGE